MTRVLGQDAVPGIPQNIHLEEQVVLSPEKIVTAAKELLAIRRAAPPASVGERRSTVAAAPTVLWTPNRNFVA